MHRRFAAPEVEAGLHRACLFQHLLEQLDIEIQDLFRPPHMLVISRLVPLVTVRAPKVTAIGEFHTDRFGKTDLGGVTLTSSGHRGLDSAFKTIEGLGVQRELAFRLHDPRTSWPDGY